MGENLLASVLSSACSKWAVFQAVFTTIRVTHKEQQQQKKSNQPTVGESPALCGCSAPGESQKNPAPARGRVGGGCEGFQRATALEDSLS